MASTFLKSFVCARAHATAQFRQSRSFRTDKFCIKDVPKGGRSTLHFSTERRVAGARGSVAMGGRPSRIVGAAHMVEEDVGEEQEESEPEKEKISRNASKKQSSRAKEWGRELASLPAALRRACKWASLDEEVYDAVMLVKNLGISSRVKNGRRRQYNYIGGLLRDVDRETMETVLKATKDGDVEGLISGSLQQASDGPEESASDSDDEDVEEGMSLERQQTKVWIDGLLDGNRAVEDEIYSLHDVDFDRQSLGKLVREARRKSGADESSAKQEKAQRELFQFLLKVVRARLEDN